MELLVLEFAGVIVRDVWRKLIWFNNLSQLSMEKLDEFQSKY